MYEYKQFYRRKLPHVHSPGGTLFVTFRLANSIPKSTINRYKNEKQFIEHQAGLGDDRSNNLKEFHRNWFRKFEEILHAESTGPVWLKDAAIAAMLSESFLHRNGREFDLKAFCIMSNHVHIVFKPFLSEKSIHEIEGSKPLRFESSDPTLGVIMQSLKGYTARKANKILSRSGQFWETESYDHEVRDMEEYSRIIKYVLRNPVKAKIVDDWRAYKWMWLADGLLKYF